MNLYEYAPPLFSIFLLVISDIAAGHLRHMVEVLIGNKRSLNEVKFIQNVALDWATRLNFFSLITAAIFSVYAIFGNIQSYSWTFIAVAILLIIFIPTHLWIASHNIGDLVAISRTRLPKGHTLNVTPARVCDGISIIVNCILLLAILASQLLGSAS